MAEPSKRSPRNQRRGLAPAGGTADEAIATPRDEPEAREVAAGPTSATRGRRRVERPTASPGAGDVTAPTSGTRSGPTGTAAGGGAAKRPSPRVTGQTSADSGGSTTAAPTMPGPTGPAQTTELVGDPGAAPPRRAEPDPAPLRPVVAGPREAVADEESPETTEGPFPTPGAGGTGPIDPIYDVERIQRALARRAVAAVRSPTERR